jgi:hypothetical protein
MDGLNVKFSGSIIDVGFFIDKYGSLIPRAEHLQKERVVDRINRQLTADTGLWRRMTEMYYNTDVSFTDNPYGNSPAIAAGIKLFGDRPKRSQKFRGKLEAIVKPDAVINKQLDARQRKIVKYTERVRQLHAELEPADKESKEYIMWLGEGDQSLTGGGFDGNSIGEVCRSGLRFIKKAVDPLKDYVDGAKSSIVVEAALKLKDHLISQGLRIGSLSPDGATKVRFDQDKDGMIGFPIMAKANAPLSKEVATRLLIENGIDTRHLVGSMVTDKHSKNKYRFRNIDALAYILDRSVFGTEDLQSIVVLLARIQKHGWKLEGDKLVPKPGKTRSIYPNSAREGMIEAMIAAPFLRELQRLKIDIMPSLQTKDVRVSMITKALEHLASKEYDFLAADSSAYDATVKGSILATTLYYAVRPFYKAEYQEWFDRAIYILTFKHIIFDESLCRMHPEDYAAANEVCQPMELKKPFLVYSLTDGLISGAKFTHVGGSLYGEVVIHYGIPKLLGYEPIFGPQAGDDTLLAYPKSRISNSMTETYGPIEEAATEFGLEINKSKQTWHVVNGEVIKVFLQESYHTTTDTYGVGSIFRPLAALYFSERNKGLSVGEQLIACIARMNQGHDNPFVRPAVEFWLKDEAFLGVLFKEYGVGAFDVLVDSVGLDIDELAQRIDVGSFSWGIEVDDLKSGKIPILPIIAEVSSDMKWDVPLQSALRALKIEEASDGSADLDSVETDPFWVEDDIE